MRSLQALYLVIVALACVREASAQTNITSSSCVDPSGYDTCRVAAGASTLTCRDACEGSQLCYEACGCTWYQQLINCAGAHCWNEVYSCEYEELIAEYFELCNLAEQPIPFWPAPDDAPGDCSCNLGQVTKSTLDSSNERNSCINNVTAVENVDNIVQMSKNVTACSCCALSKSLSASYDICPNTLPSLSGVDLITTAYETYQVTLDSCTESLESFDCVNDLGFEPPTSSSTTFYREGTFPTNGTDSLSFVGSTVTSPVSGATYIWVVDSTYTYTITAVSANGKAATGKTTGTTTGSEGAASGTGSSGSSETGSSSGSKSEAFGLRADLKMVSLLTAAVFFAFA